MNGISLNRQLGKYPGISLYRQLGSLYRLFAFAFVHLPCTCRRVGAARADLSVSVVNMRLALVLCTLCTCHCAARPLSAIVVGGSSGMGKAAAVAVASRGGRVLIASRSQDKLDSSAEEIRLAVPTVELTTRVLDASDEMAVQAFAEGLDAHSWDALICTAAGKAPQP